VRLRREGSRHPVGQRRGKRNAQVPEDTVLLGIEDAVTGGLMLLLQSWVQLRGHGAREVLQRCLGGRLGRCTRLGQQLESRPDSGAKLGGHKDGDGDVVCKHSTSRGLPPRGEREGAELPAVLESREVGGEEVGNGKPELAAQRPALGDADLVDGERRGKEPVDPNLS
jgi:hypothetical protein